MALQRARSAKAEGVDASHHASHSASERRSLLPHVGQRSTASWRDAGTRYPRRFSAAALEGKCCVATVARRHGGHARRIITAPHMCKDYGTARKYDGRASVFGMVASCFILRWIKEKGVCHIAPYFSSIAAKRFCYVGTAPCRAAYLCQPESAAVEIHLSFPGSS